MTTYVDHRNRHGYGGTDPVMLAWENGLNAGRFNKVILGAGLTVTDEGGGVVTVDGDAGGAVWEIKVVLDGSLVTTGDGKIIVCVPEFLNGTNLLDADAFVTTVSSSGLVTVQLRNVTAAADMLTTRITIDVGEKNSYSAATAAVIDTAHDDVATGTEIAVDVDVAGTGAKGLGVILVFG